MRFMFRRAATGGLAFAVAALTMVGLAAVSAQADPVAPSLTCATDTGSQQRTINCTVTAPDGNLHFVRVNNITLGQTFVVSSKLPCSTGGLGGSANLNFRAPEGNKYKITVADCNGGKYVYKIDKNGNVITPRPTASLVVSPGSLQTTNGGSESPRCGPYTLTGSGLEPGSITLLSISDGTSGISIGVVGSDGTTGLTQFFFGPFVPDPFTSATDTAYVTATAADGTTITSNTVSCSTTPG